MSTLSERARNLGVLGCAAACLYLLVAVVFWTEAVFHQTRAIQFLLYVTLGALTFVYFIGISSIRRESTRTIVAFGALFAVLGFITVPFDSTDVFFYIAQGWQQSHYNNNPYAQVLRDVPDGLNDPMIGTRWMELNRNPWLDEPLPYGFGFALVTRGLAWLGRGNLLLTLALFNLLNVAIHAAVSYLLWRTAKMIPGTDAKLVLYLYTWSPLVVLQFLANAHNDLMMAALIILAFYLLLQRRLNWVLPALVAAGFVKYVAFALIPFALAFLFRSYGWKVVAKNAALGGLVAGVLSFPYVWNSPMFRYDLILEQFGQSTGSLHAFLMATFNLVRKVAPAISIDPLDFSLYTKILLWSLVGMFSLYQLNRGWTHRSAPTEVATRWTSILFAIIFVGSSQFYAWYIGMLFPLSLLGAGTSLLTDIVVLLSGTHMLGFTFLRTRGIGYFAISTALPVLLVLWRRYRVKQPLFSRDP